MKRSVQRALTTVAVAGGLVAAATPPASAAVIVGGICGTGTVRVCIEEVEATRVNREVFAVAPGSEIPVGSVAAYLDSYALDTIQFPCVTPVVNGVEQDICGRLGFRRVARVMTLVEPTAVGVPVPSVTTLATLYICEADLTATAATFGIEKEPILALCQTGMPTFMT